MYTFDTFDTFIKCTKFRKCTKYILHLQLTTNPHNRFYFFRLCGLVLSLNKLFGAFCGRLLLLISRVRGSRCHGIICVLILGDIRRGGGYLQWIDFDGRTYGAWHSKPLCEQMQEFCSIFLLSNRLFHHIFLGLYGCKIRRDMLWSCLITNE